MPTAAVARCTVSWLAHSHEPTVHRANRNDRTISCLAHSHEPTEAVTQKRSHCAGRSAKSRIEGKAKAFAKRRALLSKFLYTQPVVPKAGQTVDVFYNPDHTSLRGRPEVWLRGSWNRWKHNELVGPLKMEPSFPGALGFLKVLLMLFLLLTPAALLFSTAACRPLRMELFPGCHREQTLYGNNPVVPPGNAISVTAAFGVTRVPYTLPVCRRRSGCRTTRWLSASLFACTTEEILVLWACAGGGQGARRRAGRVQVLAGMYY